MVLLHSLQLFAVIHSAHQTVDFKIRVFNQLGGIIGNLNSQLPGRRHNQCTGLTHKALVFNWVFDQIGNGVNQKGRCFTGSGLRLTNNIMAI